MAQSFPDGFLADIPACRWLVVLAAGASTRHSVSGRSKEARRAAPRKQPTMLQRRPHASTRERVARGAQGPACGFGELVPAVRPDLVDSTVTAHQHPLVGGQCLAVGRSGRGRGEPGDLLHQGVELCFPIGHGAVDWAGLLFYN